jgi:putative membrane protein
LESQPALREVGDLIEEFDEIWATCVHTIAARKESIGSFTRQIPYFERLKGPLMLFAVTESANAGLFPWPPTTLWEAALATIVFGVIGIGLAVFGFKVFDRVTPGNLEEEIVRKSNVAAAIMTGAFILGICLIIARVVGS